MAYNNHVQGYVPYHKMNQEQKMKRFMLMDELSQLGYSYLKFIKLLENPKYTNKFLEDFIFELKYGNIEQETNSVEQRLAWQDFNKQYQQMVGTYIYQFQQEQLRLQEEQMRLMAQTIPISSDPSYNDPNTYYAQGYSTQYNQQQYNPQYNQQYNPQYNQQQYNQQQYNQQQYNQSYNQQYYQQQGHNQSGQNYMGQNKRSQNQQGYPNNRQHPQKEFVQRDHYSKDYNQPGQYHHHNKNRKEYSQKQIETQPEIKPQIKPQVIVEPEPIPEPKIIRKPVKFSIEQIKNLINIKSEELTKWVNPQVITKVQELSKWEKKIQIVQIKDDPKFTKKESKRQDNRDNNKNQKDFKFRKEDQVKIAEAHGYNPKEASVVIHTGVKQTLGTRLIKDEIKKKAGQDFTTLKLKEQEGLSDYDKARKEIIFNLNLLVPENLKEIEKDLIPYLFPNKQICRALIQQIIKKAWDQPKYASTYAKLCHDFCKSPSTEFKFQVEKNSDKKAEKSSDKNNPFKYHLLQKIQHSFDQKIQKFPEFTNAQDKEIYFKQTKKIILSNVKFIAELILSKVLSKRIIKSCISQLITTFTRFYAYYTKLKQIQHSTYDFYFEAVIEFIENIGEKYQSIDEDKKKDEPSKYIDIKNLIDNILDGNEDVGKNLDNLHALNADEYFKLLAFLNQKLIKKLHPRLSALLQNLEERRVNKWQKHLSAADGPKTIKAIKDDILKEQDEMNGKNAVSKEKIAQQKLDKKVKQLFQGWESSKKEQLRDIRDILKNNSNKSFYISYLKQVADEKKDNVLKRIELFPVLLTEKFNFKDFRNAWFTTIKDLAYISTDFPFCGAALAKILSVVIESQDGKVNEFYQKFEDEDQQFFMEEILQKYYHYSNNQDVLKFVKPKAKLGGLL